MRRLLLTLSLALVAVLSALAGDKYQLVTDASTLNVGDQIIIVNNGQTYALGTTQNPNYRSAVSVDVKDNIVEASDGVQVITLAESSLSGYPFLLKVGENDYLYSVNSNNNYLRTTTTTDPANTKGAPVKITNDGIVCNQETKNALLYNLNTNNPIFSYYAPTSANGGTMQISRVYKLASSDDRQPAELTYEQTEYTANLGEPFTAPTLGNPHSLTVAYSSSNTDVADVDATSGAITLKAAGTTTITASTEGDASYQSGSASYTLTVVDPNQTAIVVEFKDLVNGSGTSYNTTDETITASNIYFVTNNFIPSKGQIRGNDSKLENNFYIYNTTAIPNIEKVILYLSSTSSLKANGEKYTYIQVADQAITTASQSGQNCTINDKQLEFVPDPTNKSFFRIQFANNSTTGSVILEKIEIYTAKATPEEPETQVATPVVSVEEGDDVYVGTTVTISCATEGALFNGYIEFEEADDIDLEDEPLPYTLTLTDEMIGIVSISGWATKEGLEESEMLEDYMFNVVEAPEAPQTVTATVIMKDQDLSYGKDKTVTWVSQDEAFKFSTIATITGSTYPTKTSEKDGNNLRIYNSNGNVVTVNAPEGYSFITASYVLGTAANHVAINGTDCCETENTYTFEDKATSFELTSVQHSGSSNKNSDIVSMTFVLAAIGDTTSLSEIETVEAEAVYYDLMGRRVENPAGGLYIRKQGSTVTKVIVK